MKSNWSKWKKLELGNVEKVRNVKGVYKIKISKDINRFFGYSSILYIGQGKLQDRLWCLAEPEKNWQHTAREKILKLKKRCPKIKLSFSYSITKNSSKEEKRLLREYFEKHLELPPFNDIKGR